MHITWVSSDMYVSRENIPSIYVPIFQVLYIYDLYIYILFFEQKTQGIYIICNGSSSCSHRLITFHSLQNIYINTTGNLFPLSI